MKLKWFSECGNFNQVHLEYHRLAGLYHPDKHSNSDLSITLWREIDQEYKALKTYFDVASARGETRFPASNTDEPPAHHVAGNSFFQTMELISKAIDVVAPAAEKLKPLWDIVSRYRSKPNAGADPNKGNGSPPGPTSSSTGSDDLPVEPE